MDDNLIDMLCQPNLTIGLCSIGIGKITNLEQLLGLKNPTLQRAHQLGQCDIYVGWGNKKSGKKAIALAKKNSARFLLLEDAFMRSYAPQSVSGEQPLGVVLDDQGIYYDARNASRLEQLIADTANNPSANEQGAVIRSSLRDHKICKYNNFQPMTKTVIDLLSGENVLVIDQTFQDQSIAGALAQDSDFEAMLEAAIDENPQAQVLVKLHPEVMAGKKRGYLKDLAEKFNCILLSDNFNPWDFFEHIKKVYTVSSQLGLDALMAGCQVRCFGQPFYSGWGLTQDEATNERRQGFDPSIDQLVHAAYQQYANYVDPYDRQQSVVLDVIENVGHIRDIHGKNADIRCFYQVTLWKQQRIKQMFKPQGSGKIFLSNQSKAVAMAKTQEGALVAWSSRIDDGLQQQCDEAQVPLLRLEDGFVRSVGLGANFNLPMSLIIDTRGIYYDPRQPSDLEHILETHVFSALEKNRAEKLRKTMIANNITKYNLDETIALPDFPKAKKIILVPGQVDSDASIKYGGKNMTAVDILSPVRANNNDAYIVFKPHPDVCSGQKPGLLDAKIALQYADFFAEGLPIEQLITACDEVHTISSLTGFEALLRNKKVVCYGMPFYAGWGLTIDKETCSRRTQKLSLDELIAGTLILYPRYFDPNSGLPCSPELVIQRIEQERENPNTPSILVKLRSSYGHIRRRLNIS